MTRRRIPAPYQLQLPLGSTHPFDVEIRAKWVAAKARLKARKEMDVLQNSRVEHEQLPN